jgi:hypothetical protein
VRNFSLRRVTAGIGVLAAWLLACSQAALAHHSYAMFDASRKATVSGTIAKLEWMNPHAFVWLYVPHDSPSGHFDLYAFENGSVNALTRLGWSATTLRAGDKITVEYWPLKDGRLGGHGDKFTLPDGRVLYSAGGPDAKDGRSPRPEFDLPKIQQTKR